MDFRAERTLIINLGYLFFPATLILEETGMLGGGNWTHYPFTQLKKDLCTLTLGFKE